MKKRRSLLGLLLVFTLIVACAAAPAPTLFAAKTTIALSAKKMEMTVGDSKTLVLKKNGKKIKKGVVWSSNKKAIATVNASGKVTAKKRGAVKITAKYQKKKYVCSVAVNTYALSKDKLSLMVGNSSTITLNKNGKALASGVTWKTANGSIATVSKGKITAKKAGSTKITAIYQKKKYDCSVTVTAQVKLNKTSLTMQPNTTFKLALMEGSKNITSQATWSCSDSSIVSVFDARVSGIRSNSKAGSCVVTATYNGKNYSCKVTVPAPAVTISDKTLKMKTNETYKLKIFEGSTDVTSQATWTTSDSSIVSVFDAKVSGIRSQAKEGSCTITAVYKGTTLTCKVTVEAEDSIAKIILEADDEIRKDFLGDVSVHSVSKKGVKKDVTSQANWSVGDDTILAISGSKGNAKSGKVYGLAPGTTTLTASYEGFEASVDVKVNYKYAVEDPANETGFDPDKDMHIVIDKNPTKVAFTCTDKEVLEQYKAEAEDPGSGITVDGNEVSYETDCRTATFTFDKLPGTIEEWQKISLNEDDYAGSDIVTVDELEYTKKDAGMFLPMAKSILAVAMTDVEEFDTDHGSEYDAPIYDMFDEVNGPNEQTKVTKIDRSDAYLSMISFLEKSPNARYCYFDGAKPSNNYKPNTDPYSFTLSEGPYILPAMKGIAIANYPERHMILISFAGDENPRYIDVYRSTASGTNGCWFSWYKSWRNLVADNIQDLVIDW